METNKYADNNKISLYLKSAIDFTDWFKFTYGTNVSYTNYQSAQMDYGMNSFPSYERIYDDSGNYVYQYPYNYYRSQELEQTDGLKSMRYNAAEESRYNMLDTKTSTFASLPMPISSWPKDWTWASSSSMKTHGATKSCMTKPNPTRCAA